MVGALCVFAGPEVEVEANGEQVCNVVGSGVRGSGCRGNDEVKPGEWNLLVGREILKPVRS